MDNCVAAPCIFYSTKDQLLWFLSQTNIPWSYIYQHFHPYHVLEYLRHAETWWCRQICYSCKHVNVFNGSFSTKRVFHLKTSTRWTRSPSDIKFADSNTACSCSFSQKPWAHPGDMTEGWTHRQRNDASTLVCFFFFLRDTSLWNIFFWNWTWI